MYSELHTPLIQGWSVYLTNFEKEQNSGEMHGHYLNLSPFDHK
jgi:hypothetical protein